MVYQIKQDEKIHLRLGQNIKGQARRYKNTLREELATLEKREEEESLPTYLLERKTFIQTEL
jgi:hypothetical protein